MGLLDLLVKLSGRYEVHGAKGEYVYTPEMLCERVISDAKESNHNWVASAPELLRVCNEKGFPEEYAKKIEECILNCFSNLEGTKGFCYDSQEESQAVRDIYDSMIESKDEKSALICKRYFTGVLDGIIINDCNSLGCPKYCGETYRQKCDEWKKQMLEKYFTDKPVEDWNKLKQILNKEFEKYIKTAEKQGEFKGEELFKIVNRGEVSQQLIEDIIK